jgi:hypothetical protein
MPNDMTSAKESYCIPKALVVLVIRAILPSRISNIMANTIAQAAIKYLSLRAAIKE